MIKNIVFDIGNVILKGNSSSVLNDIELTDDEYEIIKNGFFSNCEKLDLGTETIEEHFEKCNIPIKLKEKVGVKERLINYYKYREFNIEIVELMKKLKNSNYDIFILSNNNKEVYNYLSKLPMFECVNGWVVSCDFCVVKPNKEIYEILFNNYSLKPEECFFIDDKKENIGTAKSLGMSGHVFEYEKYGVECLIEDMKKNGITF